MPTQLGGSLCLPFHPSFRSAKTGIRRSSACCFSCFSHFMVVSLSTHIDMASCFPRLCPSWPFKPRSSSNASAQSAISPSLTTGRSVTSQKQPAVTRRTMTNTSSEPPGRKKTTGFVNAVYYPNWQAYAGQAPATLNLDSVSHVFYAFAKYIGLR
jgi:hypothetical protein